MKKSFIIPAFIIILILTLLFTGMFFYPSFKKLLRTSEPNPGKTSVQEIKKDEKDRSTIAELAKLKGRAAGSSYEKEAATVLARKFVDLDLEPMPNDKNFYFQTFKVPKRTTYRSGERLRFRGVGPAANPSQNVLGFLPGNSQDKVLIFTAHYDGQGINNNQVYESANDNLSGIYVLLNIAEALKSRLNRNISYLFVAFGSEEIGLYGSEYFVHNLPIAKDSIIGVINCDTVSSEKENMLIEAFNKNQLVTEVEKALTNYNFSVRLDLSELRTSDHYHFASAGINALTIAANDWLEGNHTPGDTYEKLNFDLLDQLSTALIDMALTMDELAN